MNLPAGEPSKANCLFLHSQSACESDSSAAGRSLRHLDRADTVVVTVNARGAKR